MGPWDSYGQRFVDTLLSPFPPIRAGARLAGRLKTKGLLDLARMSLIPARRLAEEHFDGEGGALLLAGNALHSDLSPETAGSGLFGWLMCSLAQNVGFPVPEGGAGSLTAALVRRLESLGGQVLCGREVERIIVRHGRADRGVRPSTANKSELPGRSWPMSAPPSSTMTSWPIWPCPTCCGATSTGSNGTRAP